MEYADLKYLFPVDGLTNSIPWGNDGGYKNRIPHQDIRWMCVMYDLTAYMCNTANIL